jgi:hypothetical protein
VDNCLIQAIGTFFEGAGEAIEGFVGCSGQGDSPGQLGGDQDPEVGSSTMGSQAKCSAQTPSLCGAGQGGHQPSAPPFFVEDGCVETFGSSYTVVDVHPRPGAAMGGARPREQGGSSSHGTIRSSPPTTPATNTKLEESVPKEEEIEDQEEESTMLGTPDELRDGGSSASGEGHGLGGGGLDPGTTDAKTWSVLGGGAWAN